MNVPVRSAVVPSPLDCIISNANWQQLSGLLYVQLQDSTAQLNFGSQTPSPANRNKPWVRTNSDGTPATPVWVYANGYWLLPHYTYDPVNDLIDTDRGIIWFGDPAQVDTLDGGEAGTVTDISGPMWSVEASIAGRVPIAPGTLPSGKTLTVGDVGGEENHVLKITELPETIPVKATLAGWKTNIEGGNPQWLAPPGPGVSPMTTPSTAEGSFAFNNDGGDQGHNTLPPYCVVNFLRKTARKFYRLPG